MPPFWIGGGHWMMCVKQNGIDIIGQICNSFFLGVNHFENSPSLEIFPSPANQFVTIKTEGEFLLNISDMTGNTITEQKCNKEYVFNCTSSMKGIYIFHIKTKDGIYIRKIVINGI